LGEPSNSRTRLGDLKASNHRVCRCARRWLNLIALGRGTSASCRHIGYRRNTAFSEIENAILAVIHVFSGDERGQAKSSVIRSLPRFLDPLVPVVGAARSRQSVRAILPGAAVGLAGELGEDALG